jgi:NADPH:quinone reductase-like Zn-dependent oxidoreductase
METRRRAENAPARLAIVGFRSQTAMKAVRIHSYGGKEVLAFEDAPLPEIGDDEVLIRVHAASVNPFDWKVRQGYLAGYFDHALPLTLGWDVSGEVAAAGPEVTGFAVGDAVFSRADVARNGGYAEYIAVPASMVEHKPQSIDHIHTAAIPNAALAAWRALIDVADLQAGQTALIHAIGGGVGTFAAQIAKWRGAYIIGTASTHNHEFLARLGVDRLIDYNTTRFEDVVQDVDVVLDDIGGETQERSWKTLKPGGILVSVVQPPSEEQAATLYVRAGFATAETGNGALSKIAALIEEGHIRPVVGAVFPLADVAQAHALSESMHARGKIVLQVV